MYVSPHVQDMTSLHPLQQLVLVPGHLQSVSQFLLSQTQSGQQGKNSGVFHIDQVQQSAAAACWIKEPKCGAWVSGSLLWH